jgi:hypothetical protein
MWKLGDLIIREGKSWRDSNGFTHPQTWARWTDDEKKTAGLTYQADPKPYDNRFYWGWNADETSLIERNIADVNEVDDDGNPILDEDGNQVVTLGLKSIAVARTKETAGGILSKSDWYVTRKTDAGTAIPSTVTDYRTAVRAKSKTIEDAINACDTLAKFMALYETPVDSNGNPTGNAPIHDWPKEI